MQAPDNKEWFLVAYERGTPAAEIEGLKRRAVAERTRQSWAGGEGHEIAWVEFEITPGGGASTGTVSPNGHENL